MPIFQPPSRTLAAALGLSLVLFFWIARSAHAQEAAVSGVVVSGSEIPSAYGALPAFSRTRVSPTTTAYVLPPGAFLAATIYEGVGYPHGRPDHFFTQEIEVGLPYRFGLAAEFALEHYAGRTQARAVSLEGRYAFANWNKIPLNPTIFAEYKFGTGRILHDEAIAQMGEDTPPPSELQRKLSRRISLSEGGPDLITDKPEAPDAVEGRLLLAQDLGEKIEWALNGFVEQEIGGDRGREWGFAQSVVTPLTRNEWLKAGVEMLYTNFSDKGSRDDPENRFVIGPTIAFKPNKWSRIDLSPLFGVNEVSPRAQVFVVFSMLFGGSSSGESEAPASTRNR